MSDKLKIKISIANRVYPLIIDPKKEESLRIAAQEINSLVKKLKKTIQFKTNKMHLPCAHFKFQQRKNNQLLVIMN